MLFACTVFLRRGPSSNHGYSALFDRISRGSHTTFQKGNLLPNGNRPRLTDHVALLYNVTQVLSGAERFEGDVRSDN